MKAEKTVVRGFRITSKSLEQLDKIRVKQFGGFVKLNKYLQIVIDEHIKQNKK